jgi:hypothetical protein
MLSPQIANPLRAGHVRYIETLKKVLHRTASAAEPEAHWNGHCDGGADRDSGDVTTSGSGARTLRVMQPMDYLPLGHDTASTSQRRHFLTGDAPRNAPRLAAC